MKKTKRNKAVDMNKYILYSTPSAVSTRQDSFVFPLAVEEKKVSHDFIPRKTLEQYKALH